MFDAIRVLLVLHFIGLTMGFATGFGNMVMAGVMAKATPDERKVLGRFPPVLERLGDVGLALLWITGLSMVFLKWDGFGNMPGLFHAKLTAVVLMTLIIGFIHSQSRKAIAGDPAAMSRVETAGKIVFLLAVTIVILAVWTFN